MSDQDTKPGIGDLVQFAGLERVVTDIRGGLLVLRRVRSSREEAAPVDPGAVTLLRRGGDWSEWS